MPEEKTNIHEEVDDLDLPERDDSPKTEETEKKADAQEEVLSLSQSKIVIINKLLENITESADKVHRLISGSLSLSNEARTHSSKPVERYSEDADNAGKIVEGVFDGEGMIGPDGKQYSVPANYASKSKLVEGDILKLTITGNGSFIYKQIAPIERSRVVGALEKSGSGFVVASEGKKWKLITASVTYYKGQEGDEVVVLVPKVGDSKWAAVDNIVKAA